MKQRRVVNKGKLTASLTNYYRVVGKTTTTSSISAQEQLNEQQHDTSPPPADAPTPVPTPAAAAASAPLVEEYLSTLDELGLRAFRLAESHFGEGFFPEHTVGFCRWMTNKRRGEE